MRGRTFQKVCERIPDALVVAHPQGQLVWFNDAFCQLLGVDHDVLRWKPFLDFVHPDDRERTKDAYLSLFARKLPIRAFPIRLIPRREISSTFSGVLRSIHGTGSSTRSSRT